MALGKNIKQEREARGWSQGELSRRTNYVASQGAISALEKRDSKTSEFAPALAEALGIGLGVLMGLEQEIAEYFTNFIQNSCPVITWDRLQECCYPEFKLSYDNPDDVRYCPVKHSPKTFVLIVNSESMMPEYPYNSEIFVDPMIEAIHNDDVIACSANGTAALKRLQISNEGRHLIALNPNWPNRIIEIPESTRICGVVIYSGKKRR